ncbi:hypothetical protein WA158_001433 [Blastocystis sp. Blastoise]
MLSRIYSVAIHNGKTSILAVRNTTSFYKSLVTEPETNDDDFVSTDVGKKKAAAQKRLKEIAEEAERKGREKAKADFLKDKEKDYIFDLEDDEWVEMKDPKTGEWNPPRGCLEGAEPTRFGDWERKGRCTDF